MTDIKRVGDSGIHTVEGNIAGGRAARLTQEREHQKAEYEAVKSKIKEQNASGLGRIDDKFNVASSVLESEFRKRTVGLVTAEEFRSARENAGNMEAEIFKKAQDEELRKQEIKDKERAEKRRKMTNKLSFNMGGDDDDDNEDDEPIIKKKISKDPNAETSYLPDRDRDMALEEEKQKLRMIWLQEQEVVKEEVLY